MKKLLEDNKIYQIVMDYLYPRRCPICDEVIQQNHLICDKCVQEVKLIKGKRCQKCSKNFEDYEHTICYDCRKQMHEYERGFALFEYHSIVASLFRFKYGGRPEYARYYATMIARHLGEHILAMKPDAIIPIPLHEDRFRSRGYNQAELIALEVGKQLGILVDTTLVTRVTNTKPQKLLTGVNRQKNLKKAFHIARNEVKLNTVILLDDIYTTGSTINEVARELRTKNVNAIYFISVAIGDGF